MSCSKRLKYFDDLGHSVEINFNRQGTTVTTLWGSFISIVTRVIIYIYLYIKLRTMFENGNNSITENVIPMSRNEFGNKTMEEMELMLFMQLKSANPATLL